MDQLSPFILILMSTFLISSWLVDATYHGGHGHGHYGHGGGYGVHGDYGGHGGGYGGHGGHGGGYGGHGGHGGGYGHMMQPHYHFYHVPKKGDKAKGLGGLLAGLATGLAFGLIPMAAPMAAMAGRKRSVEDDTQRALRTQHQQAVQDVRNGLKAIHGPKECYMALQTCEYILKDWIQKGFLDSEGHLTGSAMSPRSYEVETTQVVSEEAHHLKGEADFRPLHAGLTMCAQLLPQCSKYYTFSTPKR